MLCFLSGELCLDGDEPTIRKPFSVWDSGEIVGSAWEVRVEHRRSDLEGVGSKVVVCASQRGNRGVRFIDLIWSVISGGSRACI